MLKNCIVAQSGGPTAAINASLAGVIRGIQESEEYDRIYGALHGIHGVFREEFLDLTAMREADRRLLWHTPASYLGSCRYKMPDMEQQPEVYEQIFRIFEKYQIGAFFYIGGNDSMDTVEKLARYGEAVHSPIRFAGVPKTIDNDLMSTDHTPGFGSAAKYIATTMLEIAHDTAVYKVPCVTIVEIMGRDAGWLTAASALARNSYNQTPQLIYLPEVPFRKEQFTRDLKKKLQENEDVVVAVSEGIRDEKGEYISSATAAADRFGHAQLSGTGKALENFVRGEFGIKVRSVELNILQRCAAHLVSRQDLTEAEELGQEAVTFTRQGKTGFMTVIHRLSDEPYRYKIQTVSLDQVANAARTVPRNWINEEGNDVTEEMMRYLRPLVQGEVQTDFQNGIPVYLDISHLTGFTE